MNRAEAERLTDAALILVQAAISSQTRKKIETLQPNDWILVYHGTTDAFVFDFINGFDANQIKKRYYGGPKHKGLFVSPDPDTARKFGSHSTILLEMKIRAKNLHGVDYSGRIGREQDMDESTHQWIREKYPGSFRPYLSMTMLQDNEPQGLLRGLVKPAQIKRIWYQPNKRERGEWYTRKEFIDLGLENVYPMGKREPKPIVDLGFDVSYPGYTLEEFFQHAARLANVTVDRVTQSLKYRAKYPERLRELIERLGFEPTAADVYTQKILDAFGSERKVAFVLARAPLIVRPEGWNATSDEGYEALNAINRPHHFYRGMNDKEYQATVGRGKPIKSTLDYSHESEGTSFADEPADAESYVNFGRDDPRKTGKPNWMVEVKETPTMYRDRDGYYKDREPVDTITRVWKFYADDGNLMMQQVR